MHQMGTESPFVSYDAAGTERRGCSIVTPRTSGRADPTALQPFLPYTVLFALSDCPDLVVLIAGEPDFVIVANFRRVDASSKPAFELIDAGGDEDGFDLLCAKIANPAARVPVKVQPK
jgi:hypothetical protein